MPVIGLIKVENKIAAMPSFITQLVKTNSVSLKSLSLDISPLKLFSDHLHLAILLQLL